MAQAPIPAQESMAQETIQEEKNDLQKIAEPKDLTEIKEKIIKETKVDKLVVLAENWLNKAFAIFDDENDNLNKCREAFEEKRNNIYNNKLEDLQDFKSKIKNHRDIAFGLLNDSNNIFNKLIKIKQPDNKTNDEIKKILEQENEKGIRSFYTNIIRLSDKYTGIFLDLEKIIKQIKDHKDIGEQVQAELNNSNKENEKDNNRKPECMIKENENDNKELECMIKENKEDDKVKTVVQEAENKDKDQTKDQQDNKENKINTTEPNKKKKSKPFSSKKSKKNKKGIRNKARNSNFDYDRCKFYEEKYIKKFSYWNPTFRKKVANHQFRDFGPRNTAFNTKMDKKNDKWQWGVWTNF